MSKPVHSDSDTNPTTMMGTAMSPRKTARLGATMATPRLDA